MKQTVALIGAGYWGKNIARNLYELGRLHTICDTNEGLLDTYSDKYSEITLTSNFSSILNNPDIHEIAIAAPAFQHYTLAREALNAGKDVFVEKPLCLDSVEAEELIKIAKTKGRVLMVGHLLHYHSCVKKLQEVVATGEIGKLQYIVSNRLNLGSYRTEENALWNFAPHDISVILSLCNNQLPKKVRCTGGAYISPGVADTTLTTLDFAGELKAHIFVSWLNPYKEQKLTIVGSAGMLVFDDTAPWGEKLKLHRNHVKWCEENKPHVNNTDMEFIDPEPTEPLKEELRHFLHCCDERLTPHTDGEEGLRVLNVLQAAQESLEDDSAVKNPVKPHAHPLAANYQAHASAVIDPKAEVGSNCHIWHFSHIMSGAKIGPDCRIGQNVVVSPDVVLGKNVKVQNNVSIYSGVICEDHVFLGPSAVFTNIRNPRSEVIRRDQYMQTLLRRGATIGANATIICGIEIGEYAFVGAGAMVTGPVKPYALIVGNPGKHVGWMSRHGEKLDLPLVAPPGETLVAHCPATKEVYELKGGQVRPIKETAIV